MRRHALDRGLPVPDAEDSPRSPGEGVRARVAGTRVLVGRPEVLTTPDPAVGTVVNALQDQEQTAVLVVVDEITVAVIGLSDEPRPGVADAVAQVRHLIGAEPEILTGDAERPARVLAERVGVEQVYAGLLPADKVDHVHIRQAEGHRVLAAGDGLNDTPLLACAYVGLVVGEGAGALTVEAADGVLTRDPIGSLAPLVELARRARRISRANLSFAATVIVLLVTWDLVGTLPLALGVAGHELSTVIVCLNGLRLLISAPSAAAPAPAPSRAAGETRSPARR